MAITTTSSEARQIQMNTRIDARLKEAGDAVLRALAIRHRRQYVGSGGSL